MNPKKTFLKTLDDLVISDRETAGRPVLPPGSREQVQEALEQALVNWQALQAHFGELQKRLGRQFRHSQPLTTEQAELIIMHGVGALDEAALAALALNPVALYSLYDEIDERMPESWWKAMERDGRGLLKEHGCRIPPVDRLLDCMSEGSSRLPEVNRVLQPYRKRSGLRLLRRPWLLVGSGAVAACLLIGVTLLIGAFNRHRNQTPVIELPGLEQLTAKVELGNVPLAGSNALEPKAFPRLVIHPPRDGVAVVVMVESEGPTARWELLQGELLVVGDGEKLAAGSPMNIYEPLMPSTEETAYLVVLTDKTSVPVNETVASTMPVPARGFDAIPGWKLEVFNALREAGHRWAAIEEVRNHPRAAPLRR
jgi:hypothetical protein